MPLHVARHGRLEDTVTDFTHDYLAQSAAAFTAFHSAAYHAQMQEMAGTIERSFRAGGKLMLCGNGGSAGDAQHIAGEFLSRLMYDRPPLPALALTTDTSVMTAIGNDYGYDKLFERQVLGLGRAGDVLIGISTSGTSPNIVQALTAARSIGVVCLGFTGARGGPMHELASAVLAVPSTHTPIIQQLHITAAHIICALVERAMFPQMP